MRTETPPASSIHRPLSNLAQRIITALVGLPVVLGVVYVGGWLYIALVAALALACQVEFYKLRGADERHALRAIGLVIGVLTVLAVARPALWPLPVLAAIGLMVYATFAAGRREVWEALAWIYAGVIYPVFFIAQLIPIRLQVGGGVDDSVAYALTLALIFGIWSNDTLAYATGRLIGRRPLAPAISPKKTWEGAIGGLVGSIAALILFKVYWIPLLSWVNAIALGLLVGVVGDIGDLIESRLKREWGVKDSGTLLPGHGGMLDRIDALLFVAPLYALYLTYVARLYG